MSDAHILTDELLNFLRRLHEEGLAYARCGGLAMAVHGFPRATMDIDVLIEPSTLEKVSAIAWACGFDMDAGERVFRNGQVRLHRWTKIFANVHEAIPLDLLLLTPALLTAWESRMRAQTPGGPLWVLSREGLAAMKALRNSGQDQDDIRRLTNPEEP
jgi:hypothetical protein